MTDPEPCPIDFLVTLAWRDGWMIVTWRTLDDKQLVGQWQEHIIELTRSE